MEVTYKLKLTHVPLAPLLVSDELAQLLALTETLLSTV